MVEVVREQTLLRTPGFTNSVRQDWLSRCQTIEGFTHAGFMASFAQEHLRPLALDNSVATPSIPSALHPMLAATMASADSSLRFNTVALSGMRRGLPG